MHKCAECIAFQLPNEHAQVMYLLYAMLCSNDLLQGVISLAGNDIEPNVKINYFEAIYSYLIPHDPVVKKQAAGKK